MPRKRRFPIDAAVSDRDREEADAFLTRHITDPTAQRIPNGLGEHYNPMRADVYIVRDRGAIMACAFGRPNVVDAMHLANLNGDMLLGVAIMTSMYLLEQVAVEDDFRRRGLGTSLVGAIERAAKERHAHFVAAVATDSPPLAEFYQRAGYELLQPGQQLRHAVFTWPHPIPYQLDTNQIRWVYKHLGKLRVAGP